MKQITFSGRRARATGQEALYITEAAVFRLGERGVVLEEIAPGLDAERDIFPQMGFRPEVSATCRVMPPELFRDEPLPGALFRDFQ